MPSSRTINTILALSIWSTYALAYNENCYFVIDDDRAIDMQVQTEDLRATKKFSGYDYHYDPCHASKEIKGVKYLVWQQRKNPATPEQTWGLGMKPTFKKDDKKGGGGVYYLEFKGEGKRRSKINLICDEKKSGKAGFTGGESREQSGFYEFHFTHVSACWYYNLVCIISYPGMTSH